MMRTQLWLMPDNHEAALAIRAPSRVLLDKEGVREGLQDLGITFADLNLVSKPVSLQRGKLTNVKQFPVVKLCMVGGQSF